MVTVPEYQEQLRARAQAVQQAQQKVQAQSFQPTQMQLRRDTRSKRMKTVASFEEAKRKALSKVGEEFKKQKQLEVEFKPKFEAYQKAKAAQAAAKIEADQWKEAERLVKAGQAYQASGGVYKKAMELQEMGLGSAESQVQQAVELRAARQAAIEEIQAQLPSGEELKFDPGSLVVKGVQSEYLNELIPVADYGDRMQTATMGLGKEIPESVYLDALRRSEMDPGDLATQRGISFGEAQADIKLAEQIAYSSQVEYPKQIPRPTWNERLKIPDVVTYKDIDRGPPGFKKEKYKEYFEKGAGYAGTALGISILPYTVPTLLAGAIAAHPPAQGSMDYDLSFMDYKPIIPSGKKLSLPPPPQQDWDRRLRIPNLTYQDIDRTGTPIPTPTQKVPTYDFTYQDIDRGPFGFKPGGEKIAVGILGWSALPYTVPTILGGALTKQIIKKPPTQKMPVYDFTYKDIDRTGTPFPTPTQKVPTYDFGYKDIDRGPSGFKKEKYEEMFWKGAGVATKALGISALPYTVPSIFGGAVITKIIKSPPTQKVPTFTFEYKDIERGPDVISDIIKTPGIQQEKFKPMGIEINKLRDDLYAAQTIKEQKKIRKQLKEYGVTYYPRKDKISGQTYYEFTYPRWYSYLRPGFEKKTQKEAVVPFVLRTLGKAYEEAYTDIYQRQFYEGPTVKNFFSGAERGKQIINISPESKSFGKIMGTVGKTQFYFLPGPVGAAIQATAFTGGTVEAVTRGPKRFWSFAKEEPLEVGMAATYGLLKGYQYATKPVYVTKRGFVEVGKGRGKDIWNIKPETTISAKQETITKGMFGKGRFLETVKISKGTKIIQPRWQALIGKAPKVSQILRVPSQTYYVFTPGKLGKGKIPGFGLKEKPVVTFMGKTIKEQPIIIAKKGSKSFTVVGLSGKGKVITAKDLPSLTTSSRKSLEVAARARGWTGKTELSLKKFLSNKEVSIQTIEGRKLFRITRIGQGPTVGLDLGAGKEPLISFKAPTDKWITVDVKKFPLGKTITRKEAINILEFKKYPISVFDDTYTHGRAFFKGTTAAKDITLPFAKSKPLLIKEQAFVGGNIKFQPFYQSNILEKAPKVIKTTKVKEIVIDFAREVQKRKEIYGSFFNKFFTDSQITVPNIPSSVFGVSAQKTMSGIQAGALQFIPVNYPAAIVIKESLVTKIVPSLFLGTREIIETKTIPRIIVEPVLKPLTKLDTKLESKPLVKVDIRAQTIATTIPVLKSITKLDIQPILKPTLRLTPKITTRPPTKIIEPPATPIIKPPIALPYTPPKIRRPGRPKPIKRIKYIPFVKRYGEYQPFGKPTTFKKAKTKGIKILKRTLGASLQIRTTKGKAIKIAKETRKFRLGKAGRDPFTLVQKARFRLGSRGEVIEITKARKKGVKFIK